VAHADQLRRVFLNLLLNACDAMPNAGTLYVTTNVRQPAGDRSPQLAICIIDTGIGISPEHLPRFFEPFYITKPQGTGLGLAISMHIVTQHGGTITPDSLPGAGTTFTVTLSIAAPSDT
jgi:two-component system, NtrC family, sensor kinase